MKKYLPAITFFLIFGFTLVADGLMENLGPGGFAKAGGGVIALSFLSLWLDEVEAPTGGGTSASAEYHTPIMGDLKGFVKYDPTA